MNYFLFIFCFIHGGESFLFIAFSFLLFKMFSVNLKSDIFLFLILFTSVILLSATLCYYFNNKYALLYKFNKSFINKEISG